MSEPRSLAWPPNQSTSAALQPLRACHKSIMHLSYPARAPPLHPPLLQVRLAEGYERRWGRSAHASLCVTRAMQRELSKHWRVPATVFYDRPPAFFRPATLEVSAPAPGWWTECKQQCC